MNITKIATDKLLRRSTIGALLFTICWGAMLVLFPLKPFWRDEWCIIYNMKFKSASELWGHLDYTQQFPRVYLQITRWFAALFNYNYFSLRFPSFLISVCSICLSYSLMNKIFPTLQKYKYLFPLFIVSNPMFMFYSLQVKQYHMEILLSLVALWQLQTIVPILSRGIKTVAGYAFLCFTFFSAPFFSYTYPIVAAPVFLVVLLQLVILTRRPKQKISRENMLLQLMPLAICVVSILLFYKLDVKQVLSDNDMFQFWQHRMIWGSSSVFLKLWLFFAKAGAGFVFEIIVGVTGIVAFCYGLFTILKVDLTEELAVMRLYSCILLSLVFFLFFIGKLPLGEPKFTVFAIPSLGILIILLLCGTEKKTVGTKFVNGYFGLLFLALISNVFLGYITDLSSAVYSKRVTIYKATEHAIQIACTKHIAVLTTPGVGYPDDITMVIDHLSMPTAAGVLKTFPAYSKDNPVAIYDIPGTGNIEEYKKHLPANTAMVMLVDGANAEIIKLD